MGIGKGVPHACLGGQIDNDVKIVVAKKVIHGLEGHHWEQFLESRPTRAQRISVIASRSSVLDKYFDDAGVDRDLGIGVRLWHGTADNYFAILTKESEMGRKMADILEWDKGRKIIIEASFDPESDLNDRLQIDGLIQTGWVVE